jgi:NADPH:quinone reductase
MRAVVIAQPGAPKVLQVQERTKPRPQAHEVLIKVMAAGINRPDVAQRKGMYPPPPDAPQDIPGLEVAGIIEAVGQNVTQWQPGERVCALVIGGGYAEYCVAPEGQCLPIPQALSFAEAASLPETCFTVWSNVFNRAHLQPGETLLVHGGSSGIGVTAIQMAVALGSQVYVTAGTDAKCSFCEQLGAAKAINYETEDFAEVIAHLTGKKGVNVILDMIGGDYTPRNLQTLAEDGRLVLINTMKGKDVQVDLSLVMRKRLTLTGSTLRNRSVAFKSGIAMALREKIWPLIDSRQLKPVIHQIFKLEEAAQAHQLMESSEHIGKIILEV